MKSGRPSVLNVVLGLLLAGLVGMIGLWAVFSDLHPGESAARRIAIVAIVYIVGAVAIGALVPRWWFLAGVAAWGPFLMGMLGLIAKILNPRPIPDWRFLGLSIVVVPSVALVFGYVGATLRRMAATAPRSAD